MSTATAEPVQNDSGCLDVQITNQLATISDDKQTPFGTIIKMQLFLLAGFFAACGSFFGKLSGGEYGILLSNEFFQNIFIGQSLIFLQALFLCLMIVCNVLNWRYFLKAMQSTEQTLTATVMSAAANYIFSFLFGILIFGETMSMLSIVGMTSIVIGLCYLCK